VVFGCLVLKVESGSLGCDLARLLRHLDRRYGLETLPLLRHIASSEFSVVIVVLLLVVVLFVVVLFPGRLRSPLYAPPSTAPPSL
jgi:hypothetical protein